MDARLHAPDAARADFYHCLSAALLPPVQEAHARAILGGDLTRDLADLDREIGYGLSREIAQLQSELSAIADPQALLVVYSQLFLAPPVPARINAGVYLDGALDGGSVRAMEEAYGACGVGRDEAFHDLSDHASLQLEFVAWLYAGRARAAEGADAGGALAVDPGLFLHAYARRWVPQFRADLARLGEQAAPYHALARVLQRAVDADAVAPAVDEREARRTAAIERARARHAGRELTEEEIDEIRRKLAARGLSTEHVGMATANSDKSLHTTARDTAAPG